jgi:hypothetical protein
LDVGFCTILKESSAVIEAFVNHSKVQGCGLVDIVAMCINKIILLRQDVLKTLATFLAGGQVDVTV